MLRPRGKCRRNTRTVTRMAASSKLTFVLCMTFSNWHRYCVDPEGEEVTILAVEGTEAAATSSGTATSTSDDTTATDCHEHNGEGVWCTYKGEEYQLDPTPTASIPAAYNGCNSHENTIYCLDSSGEEFALLSADAESTENESCHFHAGVEHCTGGSGEVSCGLNTRDSDIGLRVGSLFIVLVTSSNGVYAPMFLIPGLRNSALCYNILMIVKQFGTGIIIATAFIHVSSLSKSPVDTLAD